MFPKSSYISNETSYLFHYYINYFESIALLDIIDLPIFDTLLNHMFSSQSYGYYVSCNVFNDRASKVWKSLDVREYSGEFAFVSVQIDYVD